MADAGIAREDVVFVSGIGCAARFPYYMESYGMHSIHGRAPAIASGVAAARPELSVWVVSGDGDALSIGGNHLIHALRRNMNVKILLFNNQIYGLTKGQYSPTSETGKRTKSSPMGSIDYPFNPISLALGAEATFVARTLDMDRNHTIEMLTAAHEHRGSAFIEIYQNCNVFNDKAFIELTAKDSRDENQIRLVHGEKIIFDGGTKGVAIEEGRAFVVDIEQFGEDVVHTHDATIEDPSTAFALSRLSHGPHGPTPIGIFRNVQRTAYEDIMDAQIEEAIEKKGPGDLAAVLRSNATWTVD
ncbi:MAG: 2-oxoacid:ferredoxin oxidoreductase subunit beta [Acidimicrobiia bacterium]|nr:2-oxoacid:ferredoxin oxidoreductase subunit beta [Acidimicrobiia bacterium]